MSSETLNAMKKLSLELSEEHRKFGKAKTAKADEEEALLIGICWAVGIEGVRAISSKVPWVSDRRGVLVVEARMPVGDIYLGLADDGCSWVFFNATGDLLRRTVLEHATPGGIAAVLMVALERQRGTLTKRTEEVHREAGILSSIVRALEIGGLFK